MHDDAHVRVNVDAPVHVAVRGAGKATPPLVDAPLARWAAHDGPRTVCCKCAQTEHSRHSGDTRDGLKGQKGLGPFLGFRVRAYSESATIPNGAQEFPFPHGHLEVFGDASAAGDEVGCTLPAHGRLGEGEALPPLTQNPAWPRGLVTVTLPSILSQANWLFLITHLTRRRLYGVSM